MKFSGRQLFELGVPKNKIKLFINREFDSEQSLLGELNETGQQDFCQEATVRDWIWDTFPHLPMTMKGNLPIKMSKSELGRIMDSGGIEVNGERPNAKTPLSLIDFPLTSFTWFPSSKKRVSWR